MNVDIIEGLSHY